MTDPHHPWPEVDRFANLMRLELQRNQHKGGWHDTDPETLVSEVWWHSAKLAMAVRDGDLDAVREYAADVANMAMMTYEQVLANNPKENHGN